MMYCTHGSGGSRTEWKTGRGKASESNKARNGIHTPYKEYHMIHLQEDAKQQLESFFADREKSPIRIFLGGG